MPTLKLTYFDFHGGRGEPARIALSIAGIEFEDVRVRFPEWAALKPLTPFGSIPTLEVDGEVLAHSNTINRYVGRLTGLYPEDALQAAFCDEAMDAIEEATALVSATMGIRDPIALKAAREALLEPLTRALRNIDRRLAARGDFLADGRLTVADLKAFVWLGDLASGRLDHIPANLCEEVAPHLHALKGRVADDPRVRGYHARVRGAAT
ncbi:MAG: glutathione S-transferase family protein [Myxococcales bacterium]|nr:glutathione S-transferase family protein [Myxococcales bacterium]MCB9566902.1 glutathione S-transferase family protein [Myxococcales bacterium]MCB9704634.1 glutathione S-transferase family protein [Myxococcales bacterium]